MSYNPNGFVAGHLRRTSRNLTIVGAVCLMIVLAALLLGLARHYYELFAGPFALEHGTLLSIPDAAAAPHSYVSVSGDEMIDTGMAQIEVTKRNVGADTEREKSRYQAMPVGDKLLLVETAPEVSGGTEATGWLDSVTPRIADEIIEPLYLQAPDTRGMFLPVMLKANESHVPDYIGFGALAATALFGGWSLSKVAQRRARPDAHPIYAKLKRHGEPSGVAAAIDREAWATDRAEVKPVLLTSSWLLNQRPFGLDAFRYDDLVWAYEKVTQHSYNFIPTGKTYAVVVSDRTGKQTEIQLGRRAKDKAPQLLAEIARRAPWVLRGYSDELAAEWRKNRAGVIAAVDERRGEVRN